MNDLGHHVGKPEDVERALMDTTATSLSGRKPRGDYVFAGGTRIFAKSIEPLAALA